MYRENLGKIGHPMGRWPQAAWRIRSQKARENNSW
jgi:hypothetical protein